MDWKTISIVLGVILIITNTYWIYLYSIGVEMIRNEQRCVSKCTLSEEYIAYQYDDFTGICYCIDSEENYHEFSI